MTFEKGILKEFDLVSWPVNLVVVIGALEEEVNKLYIPVEAGYNYIVNDNWNGGRTYIVENKEGGRCLMVWFNSQEFCRTSIVSHEAGHVALEIFKYTNSKVDVENQEPFCYLLGTIARLIVGTLYELPGVEPPTFHVNPDDSKEEK